MYASRLPITGPSLLPGRFTRGSETDGSNACFHGRNLTLQMRGAVFVEKAQALHEGASPGPRDGGHGLNGSSSSI